MTGKERGEMKKGLGSLGKPWPTCAKEEKEEKVKVKEKENERKTQKDQKEKKEIQTGWRNKTTTHTQKKKLVDSR